MGDFVWIWMAMSIVLSCQFGVATGDGYEAMLQASVVHGGHKCTNLSDTLDRAPELMALKERNATVFRTNCSSTMMELEKFKEQGVLDACAAGNHTLLAMYERMMRMCSRALTAHELILARVKRAAATTGGAAGGEGGAGGESGEATTPSAASSGTPDFLLVLICAIVALASMKIDRVCI